MCLLARLSGKKAGTALPGNHYRMAGRQNVNTSCMADQEKPSSSELEKKLEQLHEQKEALEQELQRVKTAREQADQLYTCMHQENRQEIYVFSRQERVCLYGNQRAMNRLQKLFPGQREAVELASLFTKENNPGIGLLLKNFNDRADTLPLLFQGFINGPEGKNQAVEVYIQEVTWHNQAALLLTALALNHYHSGFEPVSDILRREQVYNEELATQRDELQQALDQQQELNSRLEEHEEQLRMVTNALVDGISLYDNSGQLLYASPSFCQMTGYSEQELINKDGTALVYEADREQLEQVAQQISKEGVFPIMRYRLKTRDNGLLWVESYSRLHTQPSTGKQYVIAATRDISQQAAMEERLRSYVGLLEAIQNSAETPILAVSTSYRYMFFNNSHKKAVQHLYNIEIKQGMDILPILQKMGEDGEKIKQYLKRAFAGESFMSESIFGKAGSPQSFFEMYHYPIYKQQEYITGAAVIILDKTESVQARMAYEREAELRSTILNSMGEGMFYLDSNWLIEYINPKGEQVLRKQRHELIGRNLWDAFPEALNSEFYHQYQYAMQEQAHVQFESYFEPLKTWFEVNAYPSGKGLAVYFRNISSRKRYMEQLEIRNSELQQLNHELDHFVYSVSHDLRAPIASTMGLINISRQEKDISKIFYYLELQEKSLARLDRFISDIIDYSRNNRQEVLHEVVNLVDLMNTVCGQYNHLPEAGRVAKSCSVQGAQTVVSDPRRLQVILGNLVANAIIYSAPWKKEQFLKISGRVEKDHFLLEISDNGVGIELQYQPRIFDMFFRAHPEKKGSGLGLYIVKESLKKLNGSISLQSEPGKGTTFWVQIPTGSGQ